MPKVQRRRHKSILSKKRRKKSRLSLLYMLIILIFGVVISAFLSHVVHEHFLSQDLKQQESTYSLIGTPSITAAFINQVLKSYDSPAQGKGEVLYEKGVQHGIDPVYALAFFMQESRLGTRGVAAVTHSLGNIRATTGSPQYEGYRAYATWEDGFEGWYQLIAEQYVDQWGLTTVDQVIPVYAPAADNNNEKQYIDTVKYLIRTWRNGQIEVSTMQETGIAHFRSIPVSCIVETT